MDKNSIEYIDSLSGRDFEFYVANLLQVCGYKIESVTKSSGDQGVDIIISSEDNEIAVQCKRYSHSVGNRAIQEVYSGMNFRNLDKAIVITNSTFTKSAIKLADSLGVELWDRKKLTSLLNKLGCVSNVDSSAKKYVENIKFQTHNNDEYIDYEKEEPEIMQIKSTEKNLEDCQTKKKETHNLTFTTNDQIENDDPIEPWNSFWTAILITVIGFGIISLFAGVFNLTLFIISVGYCIYKL